MEILQKFFKLSSIAFITFKSNDCMIRSLKLLFYDNFRQDLYNIDISLRKNSMLWIPNKKISRNVHKNNNNNTKDFAALFYKLFEWLWIYSMLFKFKTACLKTNYWHLIINILLSFILKVLQALDWQTFTTGNSQNLG